MKEKEQVRGEIYPSEYDELEEVAPPLMRSDGTEVGIIRELSPLKVLNQLRMELRGYHWDYDEKKWVKLREPLMNDKGIGKYLSIISSVVIDLVTFSNYPHDEINKLVEYVCEKAIPVIHINYKKYGIKDKSDLQILDIQIFNLTKAAFHKALGAGDRNVIGRTYGEQITYRPSYPKHQEGGILSKLNPFSKG